MSEKKTIALPLPSRVMICVVCGNKADGQCPHCSASMCKRCWKTYKNAHKDPPLTPMGCIECGNPPDRTCSYQSPPCPAPLCHNWECWEKHEDKHYPPKR